MNYRNIHSIQGFTFTRLLTVVLVMVVLSTTAWATPHTPTASGGGAPPIGQRDGDPRCGRGDPVSPYSGKEYYTYKDLVVNGVYPIEMVRMYDSQTHYDSGLGYGWAFTYDKQLFKYPDGSIVVRRDCGVRDRYVFTGGSYVPPPGQRGQLVENGDGSFTLTYPSHDQEYYDAQGRLVALEDPQGNRLEMDYDDRGRLLLSGTSPFSLTPENPSVVAYLYRLTKVEERLASGVLTGRSVSIAYNDATGRISQINASDGRSVTYVYDESLTAGYGNLIQVLGLENVVSTFGYTDPNDPHNLTSIQVGADTTPYINTYDSEDRVIKQVYGNNVLDFQYLIPLVQTSVTETIKAADGVTVLHSAVTTYEYNEDGYPVKIVDAQGNEERYTYTSDLWLEREEIWGKGDTGLSVLRAVDYSYDPSGNMLSETVTLDDGEVVTRSWTYDQNWVESDQIVSSADPDTLFRTEYTYYFNTDGQPTNIKESKRRMDGGSFLITQYSYDDAGRLVSQTLSDGHKYVYLYENGGAYVTRIFHEIDAAESPYLLERYSYDSRDNLSQFQDARGNITQIEYDDRHRVTRVTNALGEQTLYSYDINDNLVQFEVGNTVADGEGQVAKLNYDPDQTLTSIERKNDTGAWETWASFTYDSNGNMLSVTDTLNRTTTYSYDSLGRQVTFADPLGDAYVYAYDADDRLFSITDALGRETLNTYDDLGRLTKTEKLGVSPSLVTRYDYDAVGNLIQVIDPESNTTHFEYDAISRQIKEIKPLGQALSFVYNARSQLDYVLNARGHKIDFNYEPWGAVKEERYYASASATAVDRLVAYSYDHEGNLTAVSDDSVQTGDVYTFTYDALNRLASTTAKYLPGGDKLLGYDYDRFGNNSKLTFTDGAQSYIHEYLHDKFDRVTSVKLPNGQSIVLDYFASDELKTVTYPNGVTTNLSYFSHGPLQTIETTATAGTLDRFDFTYDAVYNIKTLTDQNGLHDFTYDGVNRLTKAIHPAASGLVTEDYAYDNVGNRELPADANHYDYDPNNRLIKAATTTFSFDDDGNLTSRSDGTGYSYDKLNRLRTYNSGAVSASYDYDPFDRRIKKSVDGVTTWYLWDGDQLLAEYDQAGQLIQEYIYLGEAPIAVNRPDTGGAHQLFYVHSDHLSAPRAITDGSGSVIWRWISDSFGTGAANEDPDGDSTNFPYNIRFPGQYHDQESGLYYNFYRYYDPVNGRYITADPIGLAGGLNTYVYVNNNPLKLIDPLGLFPGRNGCNNTIDCQCRNPSPRAQANCREAGGKGFPKPPKKGGDKKGKKKCEQGQNKPTTSSGGGGRGGKRDNNDSRDGNRPGAPGNRGNAGPEEEPNGPPEGEPPSNEQQDGGQRPNIRPSGGSPALEDDPYHPDSVDSRVRPPYQSNPAHDPRSPLFNPRKTPEPADAITVYEDSIRGGMGTWYGKGPNGQIYRYFSDNAGTVHFSGTLPKSQ